MSKFKPTQDQAKALVKVMAWLRGYQNGKQTQQVFRLFGLAGTGKEQPISCQIHTAFGPKKLGNVEVGDRIYGRNGKLTTVTGVFPQGRKDVYEISFSDGSTARCGLNHLWEVWAKSHGKLKRGVVDVKFLLEQNLKDNSGYRYRIPLTDPVQYPGRDLKIHPYAMGALLGDGCFTGNVIQLTVGDLDQDIVSRISQVLPRGYELRTRQAEGCTQSNVVRIKRPNSIGRPPTWGVEEKLVGFKNLISDFGLFGLRSGDKFIPRDYLLSSVEDRIELLRGLMDTDGSAQSGGRISFSTTSEQLAHDVQQLVQSLGGTAPVSVFDRTHEDKGVEYHVNVRTHFNPFWTQRKAEKWSAPKQNTIVRAITGIRKVGKEQQLCIKVSAADELYLTDQYVVTHNTSLAKYIAQKVYNGEEKVRAGPIVFAAYTGKAAARLRQKGCTPSSTVHRLIYKPIINEDTGKVDGFKKNKESPLIGCALCVIDEVSMVGPDMGRDLEEFGIPILVLGDPGQLPPIKDEGYFTQAEPDYMLTEITRQARESPIILLALKARNGEEIEFGNYDNQVIVLPSQREISDKWLEWGTGDDSQFICGTNPTRHHFNQRARELMGYSKKDPIYPVKGEKLIALKNNHDKGIMNGTQWVCSTPKPQPIKVITNWRAVKQGWQQPKYANSRHPGLGFNIKSLDFVEADGSPLILKDIQTSAHFFNRSLEEPPWRDVANCEQFDFGHTVTGHKAQGSEWGRVVVINEAYVFREWARNWLYTAITRASHKLVLRL